MGSASNESAAPGWREGLGKRRAGALESTPSPNTEPILLPPPCPDSMGSIIFQPASVATPTTVVQRDGQDDRSRTGREDESHGENSAAAAESWEHSAPTEASVFLLATIVEQNCSLDIVGAEQLSPISDVPGTEANLVCAITSLEHMVEPGESCGWQPCCRWEP